VDPKSGRAIPSLSGEFNPQAAKKVVAREAVNGTVVNGQTATT
jgi:hypothetical protein